IRDYLQGTWQILVGLTGSKRGWIDIDTLIVGGEGVEFEVDGTILNGTFPRPLLPGQTVVFELTFRELVRKKLGRAGYLGDHYDIAQWYPKMAVYDRNGWHADQFRKGEFYGEFGDFDVEITVPDDFVIAATGTVVSGDPGWEKNRPGGPEDAGSAGERETYGPAKTVRFHAGNVHDFAWCADPDFVVERASKGEYEILSFYRKWNTDWADSVLARGIRCMEWLEGFAGPYGYPQVSIVDAPSGGGMEYPMLVMNGYPDEDLILHELGHNWFYGMLANDERNEAWLDEGMTSFLACDYLEKRYGPYGETDEQSFLSALRPKKKIWDGLSRSVIEYHRSDFAERVATPYHQFQSCGHEMVYYKGALFIRALRYYVGEEDFHRIMTTYFDRWKFRHVDEESLRSVCEEIAGVDLSEFFIQWLHSNKDCDYKVDRFKVRETSEGYTADVKIKRKGELMMPLTLAFRLSNGNTLTERIEGVSREYENTYSFDTRPVSLAVNPDNEILDVYLQDNFAPRKRKLRLDLPIGDSSPGDAYVFKIAPTGYYNDVDGFKAGLRLRGSYDDTYRKFTLQGMYGFESNLVDLYGSLENPLPYLGRECVWRTSGYYREDRQGADFSIFKTRRKHLSSPLAKHYTLRMSYQELTDTSYVYPGTYEEGKNLKFSLWMSMYPKTDIFYSSILLGLERSFWGSDFNYEKLTFETTVRPSKHWPLPLWPRIRLFFGRASIDPPIQEMFRLAGAGVLDKENYFWLRSRGAIWEDHYSNFHVPGDANLRGYYDGDFSFKSILSANFELRVPFWFPLTKGLNSLLQPQLYMFYDAGRPFGERPLEFIPDPVRGALPEGTLDGFVYDGGVGIRLWKLAVEFPLYLSHPEISGQEEKWDYRWTIGLNTLF
ncbi:MAG TPA: M1 family aminopeptidase, partial [Candidatus Krumholzibacterium sp.]|nr:M1 family aminopeptidase [Candidatus Krumholzibacterium sp.]